MTIRRRLYISNILMIVLPVVICLLVVGLVSGILMGALHWNKNSMHAWDRDFIQDAAVYAAAWADDLTAAEIERSLADVLEDIPTAGATLFVYRGDQVLFSYGDSVPPEMLSDLLTLGSGRAYTIVVESRGVYTLVGIQDNPAYPWAYGDAFLWRMAIVGLVALFGMGSIILLVNSLLTRMIFRHIMGPLSTLSQGVQEIAGGNLSYRIRYEGKDEFAPIMENFNDMAARLQAMVAAQQRDDESRRELIAGISHDLRTPLTSIIGYVEGLEKGVAATPAMQARYLAIIHEQADTLSHTINQLFLFTKLDTDSFPMHCERVDLAAEVQAYAEIVSDAYAEKGLDLTLSLADAPLLVSADRVQLRNVLTNILENSVKYGDRQEGRMDIRCFAEGESAVLTLTDNGPGVDDTSLRRMFTVFYRSDAARRNPKEGSGLGLAISARIIQRLGGTIEAGNARPHGLCIRITLPRIKEEHTHAKDPNR